MSLLGLLTETVTVYTPQYDGVDAYGDIQPGTETSATYPARLEQLESDEILRDRDTVLADWRLFLPPTATVGPFDRVESGGRRFTVHGDPAEQRSPRGAHHLELRLKRVT